MTISRPDGGHFQRVAAAGAAVGVEMIGASQPWGNPERRTHLFLLDDRVDRRQHRRPTQDHPPLGDQGGLMAKAVDLQPQSIVLPDVRIYVTL